MDNNLDKYNYNLELALGKIRNNSNYFKSFGDIYVAQKFKEYLDNICDEMIKVKDLANDLAKSEK